MIALMLHKHKILNKATRSFESSYVNFFYFNDVNVIMGGIEVCELVTSAFYSVAMYTKAIACLSVNR